MAVTTHKYRKYKAQFKTAYLQREIVENIAVDGDAGLEADYTVANTVDLTLHVGDVVKIANDKLSLALAYHASADASIDDSDAVKEGNYIVAQSDMTMEYGHVPVEYRDYKYENNVADTASAKKVALFKITNVDDLIVTHTSFDATTGE